MKQDDKVQIVNPKPRNEAERKAMLEAGDDPETGARRVARFKHQNEQMRKKRS